MMRRSGPAPGRALNDSLLRQDDYALTCKVVYFRLVLGIRKMVIPGREK